LRLINVHLEWAYFAGLAGPIFAYFNQVCRKIDLLSPQKITNPYESLNRSQVGCNRLRMKKNLDRGIKREYNEAYAKDFVGKKI
jgi:hypothetical protein